MTIVYHDDINQYPIHEVFMFISEDRKGNQGIVMISATPPFGSMPALTSNRSTAEKMIPTIQGIGKFTNKKIKLVKFVKEADIKVIKDLSNG